MQHTASLELGEMAASAGPASERAPEMLERLRRLVQFDAAWLALADPMTNRYTTLASSDLDELPALDRPFCRWQLTVDAGLM